MKTVALGFALLISLTAAASTFDVSAYGGGCVAPVDDTCRIRAAATALRDAGGGTLYFPRGTYTVLSAGTSGQTTDPDDMDGNSLAYFRPKTGQGPLSGIRVISDGATLVIGRLFAHNESGSLFSFKDASNVTVDGFIVTGPALDAWGTPHGVNFVHVADGVRNVSMPNNRVSGLQAGFNCSHGETVPTSYNVVIGALDVADSIYGVTAGNGGCDDLTVHALTTKGVTRSYVAFQAKNHTVNVTGYGSRADDVALGSPLENVRLRYDSPADYTIYEGAQHARVRMSFGNESSYIRNVDIQLNVAYDSTTAGGPAFRLMKYYDVPQMLENLRISGSVKGKPNVQPLGDPSGGPIIGTLDTPNYWSASDTIRNIELSNLRIENSKPVKFTLPGLKGPFLIENVHSDNSIQLVQSPTGMRPPENGRYTIVNSEFPNLANYYATENSDALDPVNAAGSMNIPTGWSGHTISSQWVGGSVTYSLPAAASGLEYSFVAVNATILIQPQSGQSIRGGGPGYKLHLDTQGDGVKLRCVQAGIWEIVSSNGALGWVP